MTSMLEEMKQESPELSGKERGTCLDLLCLSGQFKETVCFHLRWELCSLLLLLPLVNDVPQLHLCITALATKLLTVSM